MKTIEVHYDEFVTMQAVNDELYDAIYKKGRNDGIDDFCRWAYLHGIDFSYMGKITDDGKSDVPQTLKMIISDFNGSEEQKNE